MAGIAKNQKSIFCVNGPRRNNSIPPIIRIRPTFVRRADFFSKFSGFSGIDTLALKLSTSFFKSARACSIRCDSARCFSGNAAFSFSSSANEFGSLSYSFWSKRSSSILASKSASSSASNSASSSPSIPVSMSNSAAIIFSPYFIVFQSILNVCSRNCRVVWAYRRTGCLHSCNLHGHQKYPPLAHRFCRTPALACLSNIRTYRRSLCLFCFSYFPPPWAVPATDMNVVRGSAQKSEHCGEPELNCL